MPFPVTMEVLKRGQERFNIYCTPCHSRVGNGLGEIVQRGYKPAANLHDQVRMSQPLSHYFYVMTHGYGAMPDYSAQLTPADRWAVAAYIRALQLSQAATAKDVPAGVQVKNLKDLAADEGSSRVRAAVAAAGDGGAGISADRQRRNAGHGSGQSGRSEDFDSSKQTGPWRPRSKDEQREWLTNHNAASTPSRFPRTSSAPAFVDGWKTRALMVGAIFSVIAVILAFLGQAQDRHLGWDHFLRAWTLGMMVTWGFASAAWRC